MRFPKWLRCILRFLLLGVTGLALLIGGFYTVVRWRGDRAWREYAAQSAARGEMLDVLPAPSILPSERNFMRTPVLDRWMFGSVDDPAFEQFLKDIHATGISGLYFEAGDSAGWADGKCVDFAKTANAWFKGLPDGKAGAAAPGEAPARRLLARLAPMDSVFDELRRSAAAHPDSELARPAPIERQEPLKSPIFRFRLARDLSLGLVAHGCAARADGRGAEAFGDAMAGLKLSRGFAAMPDPFLVESMVGIVISKIALQPLWEGCQRHAWSDEQLRQFEDELSAIHPIQSLTRGLRTERASVVLSLDRLSGREGGGSWLFRLCRPRGWIQRSKVVICTYLQEDLDVQSAAGTLGFLKRMAEGAAKKEALFWSPSFWTAPSAYLAGLELPATDKVLISSARAEASLTLARTACALERHRLAHGVYPETLSPLVPACLPAVPCDIIDGQPLRYQRLADNRFKLWSVAMDGRDDDGTPVKSTEANGSGDWVWLQSARD
jgi:hypothetical protein